VEPCTAGGAQRCGCAPLGVLFGACGHPLRLPLRGGWRRSGPLSPTIDSTNTSPPTPYASLRPGGGVFVMQQAHKPLNLACKSKKLSLRYVLDSVERGISLILLIKYIFEAIPMAQGFIPFSIWGNNHTRSPYSATRSVAVMLCLVENTSPPGLKLALGVGGNVRCIL
jgi:hypothetical protein